VRLLSLKTRAHRLSDNSSKTWGWTSC